MSFSEEILEILSSQSGLSRLFSKRFKPLKKDISDRRIYREKRFKKMVKEDNKRTCNVVNNQTLRITLSRLRKQGLVENEKGFWFITKKGIEHVKKEKSLINFHFKRQKNLSKNLIIIFDIPESKKKKRNWLRAMLVDLGFSLLQKSVWFGPGPLPKDFISYLEEIGLLEHIKFFKAEENKIV